MNDYREDIYKKYANDFKGAKSSIDIKEIDDYWPTFNYLFRGWLPQDKNSFIVDLGCGNGTILRMLKHKAGYHNVSGVDMSESQVEQARQHLDNIELDNALDYLKQSKKKYDLIFAIDIIEHLNKQEVLDFINLCYKNLRKGGRLILQTPNATSPFQGDIRYGDFTHELAFTPNLLSQLLKRSGFNVIETRESGPIPYGYSMKSSIRYILWKIICLIYKVITIIEIGSSKNNIYSRVFVQSAIKK